MKKILESVKCDDLFDKLIKTVKTGLKNSKQYEQCHIKDAKNLRFGGKVSVTNPNQFGFDRHYRNTSLGF